MRAICLAMHGEYCLYSHSVQGQFVARPILTTLSFLSSYPHLPTSQHPTLRSRLITAPGCSDDSVMHMPTNRELQLRTDPATQRRSQKLPNERGRGNPR